MNTLTNIPRIVERTARIQAATYVCRSCQTRRASTQQRHIQIAKPRPLPSITSRAFATTSRLQAEEADSPSKYPDPKEDPNYVEAQNVEGLEWIGSDKWIEKTQDKNDKFTGYVTGANYRYTSRGGPDMSQMEKSDGYSQSCNVRRKANHSGCTEDTGSRESQDYADWIIAAGREE